MDELNLLIKRIGLFGFIRIIVVGLGILYIPIFTKLAGAEGYGIWTQIITLIALLQPFVQLGLGSSIVRFLANKNKKELSIGFSTILLPIICFGLIIIFLQFAFSSILAIYLLQDNSVTFLIQISAPLILIGALIDVSSNFYRVTGSYKIISLITLVQAILEISLILGSFHYSYGILGALLSIIFIRSAIIIAMLTDIYCKVGISIPNFSWLKEYLIYGVPLIFLGLFEILIQSSDRFIIGYYLGASAVGIYSAAYSIANSPSFIIAIVAYIMYPTIFSLYEKNEIEKLKQILIYSWKYLLLLLIPAIFGLSALSSSLLNILTTPEFVPSGTYLIQILCITNILNTLYVIYGGILHLRKRTNIFLVANCIAAIVNIILNIILIPRFGLISAALTTVIAYSLVFIICYKESRFLKLDVPLTFLYKSILASCVMVTPILYISPNTWLSILFCIFVGILIYFSVLFVLKAFSKQEFQFISNLL